MKEIFISHSSKQKDFAQKLRDEVGHDWCIIDCADFEPAKKSSAEIKRWFDECKIFVLLLSKDALKSDWVKFEIDRAYDRFYSPKRKSFIFHPIIIDADLKYDSSLIPGWIKEEESFNLKLFKSPIIAANIVLKAHRQLLWKLDEVLSRRENLFVGRKEELADFERQLNRRSGRIMNGAIITGRTSVGKKSFAHRCVVSELKEIPSFEPYRITMREKDNVEDFILQLNDFVQLPEAEISKRLRLTREGKIQTAVELANEICSYKGYIFITDKMGCVSYNGRLSEWFRDFIIHKDLAKELRIFVLSEIQWLVSDADNFHNLININLRTLTEEERIILFNKSCDVFGVSGFESAEVERLVKRLNHSPNHIVRFVSHLKDRPFTRERMIDKMLNDADSSIKESLKIYIKDELARNILIVLSSYEFLSHRILRSIFSEDVENLETWLYQMIDFNIVEEFGMGEAYVRLDAAVADYIKRSRFTLTHDLEQAFSDIIEEKVNERTEIDDMSLFLLEQRASLRNQRNNKDKLNVLVPSVAIKYVIELYYYKKYRDVINLCRKLLADMHNYYPQIKRELTYWLCLAYARARKERELFDTVNELADVDKYFILGFYYRKEGDWEKALYNLQKAYGRHQDMNKVRRELVEVHLKMGNIEDALELAKMNYHNRPDNVFHIQAYFHCILCKSKRTKEDVELLQKLLSEMKHSDAKSAASMYDEMMRSSDIAGLR